MDPDMRWSLFARLPSRKSRGRGGAHNRLIMSVAEPILQAKVEALRQPASYPGQPAVEAIETHMSWVFLAGDTVYKLKKSVSRAELDFSTPVARHFYCLEELRLNQPLAPAVYLDVVALRLDAAGAMRPDGPGVVVDWLVRMRRLAAGEMLDCKLRQGRASEADLRWVAQRLAQFYRGLEPAPLGPDHYRDHIASEIDQCEAVLCDPAGGLDVDANRALCERLRAVLREQAALFDARVAAGRIVEGHGDLRPEHVYLGLPPAIIDRLEFALALRTLDTLDELGYLALECERAGAPALGQLLVETYRDGMGDDGPDALLHFYQALRACIRARLAIGHLREPQYRDVPKWPARARQYLQLAAPHLQHCEAALAAGISRPAGR
jgi:aminoglycoside phosphotransferase family enzyme